MYGLSWTPVTAGSRIIILCEGDGLFKKAISHYYYHKWTCYSGLALENDWKSSASRICDLTFRSQLILRLSGQLSL